MRGRPISAAKEVGRCDEAVHEGELVLTVSKRRRRVGTEPNGMRWGGMAPCTSSTRLQEGCPHRAAVLALATELEVGPAASVADPPPVDFFEGHLLEPFRNAGPT